MENKNYYEILLAGEINKKRFMSFKINEIITLNGDTKLSGHFDDTALFSLIKVIRDHRLKLLKLELKNEQEVE